MILITSKTWRRHYGWMCYKQFFFNPLGEWDSIAHLEFFPLGSWHLCLKQVWGKGSTSFGLFFCKSIPCLLWRIERKCLYIFTTPKTNMTMENPPSEDVLQCFSFHKQMSVMFKGSKEASHVSPCKCDLGFASCLSTEKRVVWWGQSRFDQTANWIGD